MLITKALKHLESNPIQAHAAATTVNHHSSKSHKKRSLCCHKTFSLDAFSQIFLSRLSQRYRVRRLLCFPPTLSVSVLFACRKKLENSMNQFKCEVIFPSTNPQRNKAKSEAVAKNIIPT
jgi:hypothetical protein